MAMKAPVFAAGALASGWAGAIALPGATGAPIGGVH